MKSKKVKILIADDHSIVRYGILLLLKEQVDHADFYEAGTFATAREILLEQDIDLLILDINIPGGDNLGMVEKIIADFPDTKILIFSAYPEQVYAVRYLQAGANGYLHKDSSESDIKKAIETVLAGKNFLSDSVKEIAFSQLPAKKNGHHSLSNRELDVAKLLVQGKGNIEIANALNLQTTTISTYKKRIFEKLEVQSLAELIGFFPS